MPLNISLYIDLSNRIVVDKNYNQMDRDTAIIGNVVKWFTEKTVGKDIRKSKNRLKVFFYPVPADPDINAISKNLSYDVSDYKGVDKRIYLEGYDGKVESLRHRVTNGLVQIYNQTIQANNWPGCDIWDFFNSKQVDSYCIRDGFRNVLIILTDGYLLDLNNMQSNGNEANFISNKNLSNPNFRLMANRAGLQDLEVRVMEINPTNAQLKERMKAVIETWLLDMGVKQENISIVPTDLPVNIEPILRNFLE